MKTFQDNIHNYDVRILSLKKLLNRIAFLRLLVFLISAALIITFLSINSIPPVFIVAFISILCFAFLISYHNKIDFRRKHSFFLKQINESEISRTNCVLDDFDPGQRFVNNQHPYTSDLDIFGQHSIFQLLNRTTTESGMILLAGWLSAPASREEINQRQEAVRELTEKPDWIQEFQASGMHYQNRKSDYIKLSEWVAAPVVLFHNRNIYRAVAILMSVLSMGGLFFSLKYLDTPKGYAFLLSLFAVLLINYFILKKLKSAADHVVETAQQNIDTVKGYRTLIRKIECERFRSNRLCQLQSLFIQDKISAFKEINSLCKLLDFSQQRGISRIKVPIKGNAFYSLLNSFLLLDIYLIIGVEKWKLKNRALIQSWIDGISEFEALNSLAGFSFSNPSCTFPEIVDKNHYIHFEALGHPLISSKKRVCNNFHSEGHGNIVLITGSNMGGKSTFLRTVGVNLVLAFTGAPCCAEFGQVSILNIYTSMRTRDNLKEGVSSFYAELDRIEKMLKRIDKNQNVYFLLDEMFKGTNSQDRHKGGFSLISQITRLKTSGIIATHDIELAKLLEHKKLVTNYSFNSEIEDNAMLFSYKLHPGICNDFNASELMRRSGIKILNT